MYYLILTTQTVFDYEEHSLNTFFVFETEKRLKNFVDYLAIKLAKFDYTYKTGKIDFEKPIYNMDFYNPEDADGRAGKDFETYFDCYKGYWQYL